MAHPRMRRRKRCPFCEKLVWPDSRTRRRQWTCSKPACQTRRRQETQRRTRLKHPEEGAARRYRLQIAAAKAGEKPAVPRAPPSAMAWFPWEEARDEISAQVLVTLAFFARLVARLARDVIRAEVIEITTRSGDFAATGARDEMAPPPSAV